VILSRKENINGNKIKVQTKTNNMKIEILGTGCKRCNDLYEQVKKAVEQTKSTATITKVEDIMEIMNYSIMMTPAVVIDGKIISQGCIPKESEIKNWLAEPTCLLNFCTFAK